MSGEGIVVKWLIHLMYLPRLMPKVKIITGLYRLRNICFLGLLTIPFIGFGQSPERNISFSLGYKHYLINDEIGSNLNYSGSTVPFLIDYRAKKRGTNIWRLRYDQSSLGNNFNESSTLTGYNGALEYHHLRSIEDWTPFGTDIEIGPSLKGLGFVREYQIGRLDNTTGEVATSLGFSLSARKALNDRHSISTFVNVSMISLLLSSEHNGYGVIKVYPLGKQIDYNFQLQYSRSINERVRFQALYLFRYFDLNRWNDVTFGSHTIALGLNFKLDRDE